MAEIVSGSNSMVLFKGKKFQIQTQYIQPNIVTIVIVDGQVKQRVEKDVTAEAGKPDAITIIQKMLNEQHKNIELKIRAKAKQKEKEEGISPKSADELDDKKDQDEPKKRGLLDTLLRRKK